MTPNWSAGSSGGRLSSLCRRKWTDPATIAVAMNVRVTATAIFAVTARRRMDDRLIFSHPVFVYPIRHGPLPSMHQTQPNVMLTGALQRARCS